MIHAVDGSRRTWQKRLWRNGDSRRSRIPKIRLACDSVEVRARGDLLCIRKNYIYILYRILYIYIYCAVLRAQCVATGSTVEGSHGLQIHKV